MGNRNVGEPEGASCVLELSRLRKGDYRVRKDNEGNGRGKKESLPKRPQLPNGKRCKGKGGSRLSTKEDTIKTERNTPVHHVVYSDHSTKGPRKGIIKDQKKKRKKIKKRGEIKT